MIVHIINSLQINVFDVIEIFVDIIYCVTKHNFLDYKYIPYLIFETTSVQY